MPDEGVDAVAAQAPRRRRDDPAAADPYLARLGYDFYRSAGQRRALRAALSAPRGSTLVVSLPTGEGKSLVFHALARVGFGDGPGVTLVVTPTVALAADHERSSRRRGFEDMPLTYRRGDPERNLSLLNRIRDGQQSLCFASPEAVCTALSERLREAASRGLLRAIVVDEAHLIDSWGVSFRPDFQMLAGLRHQLLELSAERRFRTVLLSATLTRDSIDVIRTLFPGEPFRVVSAARLRPEAEFWIANATEHHTREERVMESLHHLPRPLILYTTKRDDAAHWYSTLTKEGFKRIGIVTGDTPDAARQRVVQRWGDGEIDIVVGTSAFGLGIDNSDVRAVVHACVPESLDRFYQEVGRGGRDGDASVSLLLPSKRDFGVARGLRKQLLTVDKARHRWHAMFTHPEHEFEDDVHTVPVDGRPGVDDREIDMVGPMNTSWNIRTLVLMAAAGGIGLLNVPSRIVRELNDRVDLDDDENEGAATGDRPRVRLAINDPMHLERSFWERRIGGFRTRQKNAAEQSLEQMEAFLRAERCAADIIAPVYEVEADPEQALPDIRVGRACGGCPSCRRAGHRARDTAALLTPHPWPPVPPTGPFQRLLGGDGQLLVFHDERQTSGLGRRRERAALSRIWTYRIRNLVLLGDGFTAADLADLERSPVFVARQMGLNDLPPGPTVIVGGSNARLPWYMFEPREPGHERIWLLHGSTPHPSKPGITLAEAPPVSRALSLSEFVLELES